LYNCLLNAAEAEDIIHKYTKYSKLMIKFFRAASMLAFLIFPGFAPVKNAGNYTLGYNLSKPDAVLILPAILHEISGITHLESDLFACIQDENGIVFFYDLKKNKIERQLHFNINGDYEGIAIAGSKIYVLRSDGALFEIAGHESGNLNFDVFYTNIPSRNNEGLCFDPDGNRLLIAPKGKTLKGPADKDKREIYAFDLKTRTLSQDPVFIFDLQAIRNFAKANKLNLPLKEKKKGKQPEPRIDFMTSAIGINPVSKKLFILSSSDYLLFISDMDGNIEHIETLNPAVFNNAEGIAFYSNGDMVITNEGGSGNPTLLLFKYQE